MENEELLGRVNQVLDNIDIQNQITIARQEGFNEGYKTCLKEIKSLLEQEINPSQEEPTKKGK